MRPDRRALTRADLPAEFTPETVRRLDVFTLRRLSDHGNGVLTADERRLIVVWTLVVCAAAGVVYAIIRLTQSRRGRGAE